MMIKKTTIKYLVTIICLLFPLHSIYGAQFSLDSEKNELNLERNWEVKLLIDTEGEYVNAFEGKITFPNNLLKFLDVRGQDEIVNFWIEKPQLINDNQISFSGITPGGYNGQGVLFKIIFETIDIGEALVILDQASVLLNDGQGTHAKLSVNNASLSIGEIEASSEIIVIEVRDNEPPEAFTPIITKIPEIYGDKYVLIFYTQDKGSGIDHYEIKEGWRRYKVVDSPYILKDQKLSKKIKIKAIDKFGNERLITIASVYPTELYENYIIYVIITSVLVLLFLVYITRRVLWKKIKQKQN